MAIDWHLTRVNTPPFDFGAPSGEMVPRGESYVKGGCVTEDIVEPGSCTDTVTMARFSLNGSVIGCTIIELQGLLGGKTGVQDEIDWGWPVHPAVCLQGKGDRVVLTEKHWSVWPCPHSAFGLCSRCNVMQGD